MKWNNSYRYPTFALLKGKCRIKMRTNFLFDFLWVFCTLSRKYSFPIVFRKF